jgi:hypothetical protein
MPVAQSPAHYINSSKGCASITESFPLCFLLEHKMSLSPLARHCEWCNPVSSAQTLKYSNSEYTFHFLSFGGTARPLRQTVQNILPFPQIMQK